MSAPPTVLAIGPGNGGEASWRLEANCAWTDPNSFYPGKGDTARTAKRICRACMVRADCLDEALANDEQYGIWGGLSAYQRRKLKRRPVAS